MKAIRTVIPILTFQSFSLMYIFVIADIETLTSPKTVTGYIGGNVKITFHYTPVLDTFTDVTWTFESFTDTKAAEVVYYYEGPPGFGKRSYETLMGRSSHLHSTNTLTLYIYNVTRSDEGVYTCIFNAGNQKTASTNLSKLCFNPYNL